MRKRERERDISKREVEREYVELPSGVCGNISTKDYDCNYKFFKHIVTKWSSLAELYTQISFFLEVRDSLDVCRLTLAGEQVLQGQDSEWNHKFEIKHSRKVVRCGPK